MEPVIPVDRIAAGAIIAGGRARRFGGIEKSRLIVDGDTIIARQLAALSPITHERFVVVDHLERVNAFADVGLSAHVDQVPGAGALGGIYTALEVATTDAVITIACDLPFLTTELLNHLVHTSSGVDGAWVVTPRGAEPLIACYRQSARAKIRREIDAGRFKAMDLGQVLHPPRGESG